MPQNMVRTTCSNACSRMRGAYFPDFAAITSTSQTQQWLSASWCHILRVLGRSTPREQKRWVRERWVGLSKGCKLGGCTLKGCKQHGLGCEVLDWSWVSYLSNFFWTWSWEQLGYEGCGWAYFRIGLIFDTLLQLTVIILILCFPNFFYATARWNWVLY